MITRLVSAKSAVASAIGTGVLLTGGVGAAAAGALPGAAQETISTWLGTVGISVPAGERADEKGDQGGSEQSPGEDAGEKGDPRGSEHGPADEQLPPAADHGKRVSDTAKNSNADGAEKGKELSEVASDGRVESGDHDAAGDDNGEPQVSTPNSGGTDTASDATDGQGQSAGAADKGTEEADQSSDGASSDGSGNRSTGD